MSWLGGLNDSFNQLSSLTGQIGGQLTNFTKEVLTETSEENVDHEVEAKRLSQLLKENETHVADLEQKNQALEERAHTAELLLSTSETDWRNKLERRDQELAQLKRRVDNSHTLQAEQVAEHDFQSSFTTIRLDHEEDEFHDIITKQREIEHLSAELERAQAKIAELLQKEKAASVIGDTQRQNTDSALRQRIQELENGIQREAEHHRKEMQTMEDCNKAAILRYQEEVKRLQQANFEGVNVNTAISEREYVANMKRDMQELKDELDNLKNQMRTRNRQLQAQKKQIEEVKALAEQRKHELDQLEGREKRHAEDKKEWEDEKMNLKSEIHTANDLMAVIRKGIAELASCGEGTADHDQNDIETCLNNFVQQYRQVSVEKNDSLSANAKLQTEIDILKTNLAQTQEEISVQHADSVQWPKKNSEESGRTTGHLQGAFMANMDFGTPIGHSSPQVPSAKQVSHSTEETSTLPEPGDLTLTKQALQKQIEDYEKEISDYEKVRIEWHAEKQSLQNLLNRYQSEVGDIDTEEVVDEPTDERSATVAKLKREIVELQKVRGDLEKDFNRVMAEKGQFQDAAKNLETQLNLSVSEGKSEKDSLQRELDEFVEGKEKLQTAYDILTQELNQSRMEKDALDEALDALDSQHQDEMNQLLVVRDDLKAQLKDAKSRLEAEKVLQTEMEKELEKEKRNSQIRSEQYDESLSERDEEIEALKVERELLKTRMNEYELSQKEACQSCIKFQSDSSMLHERISSLEESLRNANQLGVDSESDREASIEKLIAEKADAESHSSAEISRLKMEIESLGKELEDSGKEVMKMQLKHEQAIEALKTENKSTLSKTITDMRHSFQQETEATKNEAEATSKVYQQKTVHFQTLHSDLEKELRNVKEELSNTVQEKDIFIENLKTQYYELSNEHQQLQQSIESLKCSNENNKSSFISQLKSEEEKKNATHVQMENLKTSLETAKAAEINLANEVSSLKLVVETRERELHDLKELQKTFAQKDNEQTAKIAALLLETGRLKSELENSSTTELSDASEELLRRLGDSDVVGVEKCDLSKDDVGSLLKLLKERDAAIESLKRSTVSHMQSSPSPEHEKLRSDYRSLSAEKDQILSVISEKTKENRKLKDDIHKMVGVVAESKAALEKVQNEYNVLCKKYEGYDDEMTKEGISKLSRLVMEKDLEIESLKQKCGTLLEVLQQQSNEGNESSGNVVSGEQVQTLLKDKEILTSQVRQLLNERNQLVTLLNQSQVEMAAAKAEASKAAEALEKDFDNNSKLQIGYSNLVHDYDQVQLKMSSVQREFAALQEKLIDLERTKMYLLGKLEQSGVADVHTMRESLQNNANDNHSPGVAAEESTNKEVPHHDIEVLQKDSKEKDLMIHARTEELKRTSKDLSAKSNEVVILRRSVENLREQVGSLTKSCNEAQIEVREVMSKFEEKEAESQAFQETNAQLSMLLKEKEYELESLGEKCQRLGTMMNEQQQGTESESQKYLEELDRSKRALINARHEKDQVMLSLKQKKLEADRFAEEARSAHEKESKLRSELERLRNHLIQVEETYTQEAVLAEDHAAGLKEQLEKAQSHQNAVREAGEQYQQQVEGLQEQLRAVIAQRDHAIHQLQLSEEQRFQYATTIQNLQVAVERMQREEAASFAEKIAKLNSQLEAATNDANSFQTMADDLQMKLDNATDALKSASRLNVQLEVKEDNINYLKGIVAEKQLENDELQNKLHNLASETKRMVDKDILKSLFMGYFTTPANQRHEVLRLLSSVLGFSEEEMKKLMSSGNDKGARAWIGGWLWRGGGMQNKQSVSVPGTPRDGNLNQSFTQMFVKFLETESVPHQTPRLPAAAMINEAQQKRRTSTHSVPTPLSPSKKEPVIAGRYSPYLHSSTPKGRNSVTSNPVAITPMLPTFEPIINPKPGGEQEILQDILLNRGDG